MGGRNTIAQTRAVFSVNYFCGYGHITQHFSIYGQQCISHSSEYAVLAQCKEGYSLYTLVSDAKPRKKL